MQGLWEKTGNATWAQCPSCASWFHVGDELASDGKIALHCPECDSEFLPKDAKALSRT